MLGQKASFWVAATVVAHTLWTSAAPALLYPLYAQQWALNPTIVAAIFASYPLAVAFSLFSFGGLSDRLGRRTLILAGLFASMFGTALFALATGPYWILTGRLAHGLGVGLSAGAATAALTDFSAGQRNLASAVATAAMGAGLALSTALSGFLLEFGPDPLHLSFWILFVLLAGLTAAAWQLPSGNHLNAKASPTATRLNIPSANRLGFGVCACAMAVGFSIGAVVLSLGARIAQELVGSSSAVVNGCAIGWYAGVGSVLTPYARRLRHGAALALGNVAIAAAMFLLFAATWRHSVTIFVLALGAAGAAYCFLFVGSLTLLHLITPENQRAGAISAVYLTSYVAMSAIALLAGTLAQTYNLATALHFTFVLLVCTSLLSLAALKLSGKDLHGESTRGESST